ncbi:helix-turn-helix domain-containing protein [Salmonella enterica]|nr:helix-turn-helix domain-containing protein [Salmonella enterica]EBD4898310.1 helix-turn-helix domain-containing protein [Salmonella enterica]ECW1490033.1 hypothetical protein [Salmonella enterica]
MRCSRKRYRENKEMIMHQLFFFSPCHFMQSGMKVMMTTAPESVRVIPVTRPEEIQKTGTSSGQRLLLVSVPAREPWLASRAQLFLWRLRCLQVAGRLPDTPCLLLSDLPDGPFPRLSEYLPVGKLRHALMAALTQPHPTRIVQVRQYQLSPLQEKILAQSLAGASVAEMAGRLNISPRGVFAGRASLLHKLGLRNRLGLMGLDAVDFT